MSELRGSELFKNISILVSGTTVAQLIPILLQPILRRLYSPEEFGAYAVYLSFLGILVVIASLKYELAIILPDNDKSAINILALSLFINLIFCTAIFIVITLFKEIIMSTVNLPAKYSIYLFFVPLGVFLYSMYQSINYWLIRKKLFFNISINKFIRRGSEGGGQLIMASLHASSGLLIGDIIGHIGNNVSVIIQAFRNDFVFDNIKLNRIRYVMKKYIEYPKFNVIPSFMSTCSYLLPVILINKLYSAENTGFFDLSKLLLSIPLALIAISISNVLLQSVSEKSKSNLSIRKDLTSIFILVLLGGLAEIGIIMVWGEDLFRIFFGAKWVLSGTISRILVWAFAFNFIVSSFSSIFISLKKIKFLSLWQLFYFLSILSLSLFNNLAFNSFLKVYTLIEVACSAVIFILMISVVINYEKMVTKMRMQT